MRGGRWGELRGNARRTVFGAIVAVGGGQVVNHLIVDAIAPIVRVGISLHPRLGRAGAAHVHPALDKDAHGTLGAQRLAIALGAAKDEEERLLAELLKAVRGEGRKRESVA